MMRGYVATIALLLAAAALLSSVLDKPADPPLLVDEVSPGPWKDYAGFPKARPQAAPQMLFAPCPLGPLNLPIVPSERKA